MVIVHPSLIEEPRRSLERSTNSERMGQLQHNPHHHRSFLPHPRKAQEEEQDEAELHHIKPRHTPVRFVFLLLLALFALYYSRFPRLFSADHFSGEPLAASSPAACSPSSTLCCDRSSARTDVCFIKGDIRINSSSSSILILSNSSSSSSSHVEERIRPYTRKWEDSVMATIDELRLRPAKLSASSTSCDIVHDVPAVIFSTGGYTGNVYHEFNDGIIPLYLTSRRFNRGVVFVIVEYHNWWMSKYADILTRLSDHPAVDFSSDRRIHCFTQAVVGLQIHGELSMDSSSWMDFRQLLNDAYVPRIRFIQQQEQKEEVDHKTQRRWQRPKLVIISRNGSRAIENEAELVKLAEEVGFRVELLRPEPSTEMAKIYRALNSSDAMAGVHGAAMTHLLFMRPGSVFIQIVPLGLDWAAESYYGEPAAKAGLRYESYRILPRESSLSREYGTEDPVLGDPGSVNARGWEATKKVYLDGQRVKLDLARFRKRLLLAYRYLVSRAKGRDEASFGSQRSRRRRLKGQQNL